LRIGAFIASNPHYNILFGPVSISKNYHTVTRNLISFNLDREFSDVVDGLLMVDLRKTDPRLLKRFMGEEGVKRFTAVHGTLSDTANATAHHHRKRTDQEAARPSPATLPVDLHF
jgi:hypothetical protein